MFSYSGVLAKDAGLQVGLEDPLELQILSGLQKLVPLEKVDIWKGGLWNCIPMRHLSSGDPTLPSPAVGHNSCQRGSGTLGLPPGSTSQGFPRKRKCDPNKS